MAIHLRDVYPTKYYSKEGFVETKLEIPDEDLQEIIRVPTNRGSYERPTFMVRAYLCLRQQHHSADPLLSNNLHNDDFAWLCYYIGNYSGPYFDCIEPVATICSSNKLDKCIQNACFLPPNGY